MMRAASVVLALWVLGCSGDGEQYPLRMRIDAVVRPSTFVRPTVLADGAVVGIVPERRQLCAAVGAETRVLSDSTVDVLPVAEGLLVARRQSDSLVVYLLASAGRLQRIAALPDESGHFIAGKDAALWGWQSGSLLWVVADGAVERFAAPYLSGVATVVLHSPRVVTVLRQLNEQLRLWEGFQVESGRKLFSSVVSGAMPAAIVDQSTVATLAARNERYYLEWLSSNQALVQAVLELPEWLYEPRALLTVGDTVLAVFRSGVVLCSREGVVAAYRGNLGVVQGSIACARRGRQLLLSGERGMVQVTVEPNPLWWLQRSVPALYRALAAAVAVGIVGWLVYRQRRRARVLNAVLERGTQGALLVVDRKRRLLQLNVVARRLLGIDRSVPLRRPLHQYVATPLGQLLVEAVERAIAERTGGVQQLTLQDGMVQRTFLVTLEPLYGLASRFEGVLVAVFDVTAQYHQQRLVNWAQLAHDIQTNLATIRLSAEQMSTELSADDEARRQRILSQARLLLDRVRDLLALGRGESLVLEECNIDELLASAVEEVQSEATAHISFVIRPSPLVVRLDRRRMARALHNALTNAIRAIGQQPGTIELWAHLDGRSICIAVRDTGCGMDEQTLERFRQPYFTSGNGHGFGTMIMQQMVALHNGWLHVSSSPGSGTTVEFHLPRSLYVRHLN